MDPHADGTDEAIALFQRTAASVPAYREFLREHHVDAASVRTREGFARLPLVTKENYVKRYPLGARCRTGDIADCDMIAFSSGSTGEPALWPRNVSDELAVVERFEQVFRDAFEAERLRTLAVIAFPLGTWVGGMYTAAATRHLAQRGFRIMTVTPGNDRGEILRVVRALAPSFDQTVLLGYPPFLKDVIDAGLAEGVPWSAWSIRLVLAGEVISEDWRTLMAERAGMRRVLFDSASLYGTADAGVLGVETPLSIAIRRFCAENDAAARSVFGSSRLPTLVQYDPRTRYFESHEGTLVFSADGGVPLVRYHIADDGGLLGFDDMLARLRVFGFDARASVPTAREQPFVWVFGRSHFAISFYGANVFPEMIAVGLEQPDVSAWVTGKFVIEARETDDRNRVLAIAVELASGTTATDAMAEAISRSILTHLRRASSEFSHYVPEAAQAPEVTLYAKGHPEYFPTGVKHRYSRR